MWQGNVLNYQITLESFLGLKKCYNLTEFDKNIIVQNCAYLTREFSIL